MLYCFFERNTTNLINLFLLLGLIMQNLIQLRELYRLKNIERICSVKERKESSAEHSWSCLVLAEYFLSIIEDKSLDRLKIYELLIYHDLVEIESGDIPWTDLEKRKGKKETEKAAFERLKSKLPLPLKAKIIQLFQEYAENKTKETKFALAIDALDAIIQELDYKADWKGWSEEFLKKTKSHLFKDFPELKQFFEGLMEYAKEQGYFKA